MAPARRREAGGVQRLRSRAPSCRARRWPQAIALLRRHGRLQPPLGQDAQRHLARPRRAQAQDRGRCAARPDRRDRPPNAASATPLTARLVALIQRDRGRQAAAGPGNLWTSWPIRLPSGARCMNIALRRAHGDRHRRRPRFRPRDRPGLRRARRPGLGLRRQRRRARRDAPAVRRELRDAPSSMSATARACEGLRRRGRAAAGQVRYSGQQCRRRARPGRPAARGDRAGRTGRRIFDVNVTGAFY